MTSIKRYVVLIIQLQSPNIVDRAPISVRELNELQGKIEEQQRKINNSERLGTTRDWLKKELRQLKLESQNLHEQLLETK